MKIFSDTGGTEVERPRLRHARRQQVRGRLRLQRPAGHGLVWKWTDALGANTGPEQITSNFTGIRFTDNYNAYTIAVVPDGVVPPEPDLTRLRDVANGGGEDPDRHHGHDGAGGGHRLRRQAGRPHHDDEPPPSREAVLRVGRLRNPPGGRSPATPPSRCCPSWVGR